jgi:long-chain fatty acid transport protein
MDMDNYKIRKIMHLVKKSLIVSLGFACLPLHANVIQYFAGISYSNPAELFTVQKNEFILGTTAFRTEAQFKGTALNFNTFQYDQGVAHSGTTSVLPYGRIATRINEKWVFGVDVTEPFNSNLSWGNQAFTRYAATQTYLTDVDISPRLSYSFSQRFYVGAGLNFNFLKNNETNWAMPVGPTAYANMRNQTSSFGLGYNLGAYFIINPTNFLGITYYSTIRNNTFGYSQLANNFNTNLNFDFNYPATTVLSYVHLFSKTWLANFKVYYCEWDVNQFAIFRNTAAPPPVNPDFAFRMGFSKSAAFLGAVRHQITDKLGGTLIGMVDYGPERDSYRPLNFPSDTQYFVGLAGDYRISKTTTIELLYGYGFEDTRLQNTVNIGGMYIPFTTGKVDIHANIIDLKLKVQV